MTSPDEAGWIGSASRQAALPAPLRDLHRAVLRRFLDTGTAPALDWLRQAAGELGLGDSAVADLEAADLVHSDGGAVTVAYPFSGVPTRQQVELGGFPAVWAMCAIDALGIPVMAGRDGRIAATDPRDGAPVVVSVKGATEAGGGKGWAIVGSGMRPRRDTHPDWPATVSALLGAGASTGGITLSPDDPKPPSSEVAALLRARGIPEEEASSPAGD